MQFEHPELLYALFLLIIPVLVHLFQLRKFRKEKFTNVKFLKKASLQTRKSSRIKKWLILCTRLLLLAAVIIAFARPYIPTGETFTPAQRETVIYLDNSYSMQAKGSAGVLLRRSVQELLENLPEEGNFTFFTNDVEYRNISSEALRKDLRQITYSPVPSNWPNIVLRAQNLFTGGGETERNFIAISDFQTGNPENFTDTENFTFRLVQQRPESIRNVAVDSAFIEARSLDESILGVQLSGSGNVSREVPVSLYNNGALIAKKTVELEEDLTATTTFNLSAGEAITGRIAVDDAGLSFDDDLFFSINPSDPIEVVAINNSDDAFLRRIYREPEFNFRGFPENQVDFNVLSSANLIILNETESITSPLAATLNSLLQQGVYLVVIPPVDADLRTYNYFFREAGLPVFQEKTERERHITNIAYGHPLYEGVFDQQVENFQYPRVQSSYSINSNQIPVLSYENGEPFLFQSGNSFVFTAPINPENSNFQRAPLIVPSFYNIGNFALRPARLYYTLAETEKADINVSLGKDEILQVSSGESGFIPRQQSFQNKVELTFEDSPREPGHYRVMNDSIVLQTLAFNVDRTESRLDYAEIEPSESRRVYDEISEVFRELETENNTRELWKWFIIFALVLLLTEMLILKYFK